VVPYLPAHGGSHALIQPLKITPFDFAQRYVGVREISGAKNHPLVSCSL
jgi:hypothetical protein